MAVANLWKPDKIVLGNGTEFSQFTAKRVAPQMEEVLLRSAGHPHPSARGTRRQRPLIEFTTPQIDQVATIPVTGLALTDDSYLYFKHAAATGVTAADSRAAITHRRLVVSQLVAYWTTMQAPHAGQATATVIIAAVYDGVNDPLVSAGTVALSGDVADGNEVEFGCGPVELVTTAGTVDLRPQNLQINSGVQLHEQGTGSELWDTFVGINTTEPIIEVTSKERISLPNVGLQGLALSGNGLRAYFRKTGPRAVNATAAHVLAQAAIGTAAPGDSQLEEDLWNDTIRIACTVPDDDTQPITLTPDVAIAI